MKRDLRTLAAAVALLTALAATDAAFAQILRKDYTVGLNLTISGRA